MYFTSPTDTTNGTEISSTLPTNEILVAMGYLLQIEYEVIGKSVASHVVMLCHQLQFGECS